MAETLSLISIISFLAAGAFAILAVVLWFVFHIPTVAGELSGRTARKSVERMRESNAEAARNARRAGPVKGEGKNSRGTEAALGEGKNSRRTEATPGEGKNSRRTEAAPGEGKNSRRTNSARGEKRISRGTDAVQEERRISHGTDSVQGEDKNPGLDRRQAGRNRSVGDNVETAALTGNLGRAGRVGETEVLVGAEGTETPDRRVSAVKIELLEEILFIHTEEVIE